MVTPNKGRIAYWEAISNASSFVPGQTSSGVQGSIPGMLSGETVTEIINAEPAGFILTFSHGRVAHLTVRDQMGRPGIGIQFLRKLSQGGGVFGSIRNVFGTDRRKGVPAVRAGKAAKGQREIIIATEDGSVEFWSTNLTAGNTLTDEVNIKEDLLDSLKHTLPEGAQGNFQFKVLDFVIGPSPSSSQELVRQDQGTATPLVVLAALTRQQNTTYYVIELSTSRESVKVDVVHVVKCYNALLSDQLRWRPRLSLPDPHQTAFIIFETAIVLYSMARIEESPSSQLLMERNALPEPFQDCVKFQDDTIYKVQGYAAEEQDIGNKHAAVVVAIQGFGNIRITSVAPQAATEDLEEVKITLKSKIEQAVFFGTIRQNPLDLTSTSGKGTSQEELEEATLKISDEILGSTSKYLPKMAPSLDQQMRLRAKALEDLSLHVLKHYKMLSRATRWKLLWNAEKLAAAQAIWRVQEDIQKRFPKDREFCLMEYVLTYIHESRKTKPNASKGEKDRIRHWLINDPGKMEHFITYLAAAFKEMHREGLTEEPTLMADFHREANDIWLAIYETALRFRENSAAVFGLADDVIKEGILTTGYAGIPEPWTSEGDLLSRARSLVNTSDDFLKEWWNTPAADKGERPPRKIITHIAQRLPEQVEIISRLSMEQEARLSEVPSDDEPYTLRDTQYYNKRHIRSLIQAVAIHDNMPDAIRIAEKLSDTTLLVTLNTDYAKQVYDDFRSISKPTDADVTKYEQNVLQISAHAESYFDKFGDRWAFSHFQQMVRQGELGDILIEAQSEEMKQPFLTRYLRRMKKYGKLSWINDVIGQGDFHNASRTLEMVAEKQETDIWNKRTELCLAKLADLAAAEKRQKGAPPQMETMDTSKFDQGIQFTRIQDRVYQHVLPVTKNTIDETAAQEVALDTFGQRVVEKKPATRRSLNVALGALLSTRAMSPELLIDLLTLMDPRPYEGFMFDDPNVFNNEFGLALDIIDTMPNDTIDAATKRDALRKLAWRRAMTRDDWVILNDTAMRSDAQVQDEMTQTALYLALEHLAQQAADVPEAVIIVSPDEVLSAEAFPEVLRKRWPENEREIVGKELEGEVERLGRFVGEGRLQVHFEGLVAAAKEAVRMNADRRGEEAAAEEEEVAMSIERDEEAQ